MRCDGGCVGRVVVVVVYSGVGGCASGDDGG